MEPHDPSTTLPTTDPEAHAALRATHPGNLVAQASMCGIYDVRRARGATVLDAYEVALWAAIGPETRAKLTAAGIQVPE